MKLIVTALLTVSTMALVSDEATAGRKTFIKQQRQAAQRSLKANNQARRDIHRVASKVLPNYQHRQLHQTLRNHAVQDRQFNRDYQQQLRSIPRYRSSFGYNPYGFGGSGIGISSRGITFSRPGFSISFGR